MYAGVHLSDDTEFQPAESSESTHCSSVAYTCDTLYMTPYVAVPVCMIDTVWLLSPGYAPACSTLIVIEAFPEHGYKPRMQSLLFVSVHKFAKILKNCLTYIKTYLVLLFLP